ncbi:MAG: hypothetical protein HN712_04230 [Gemmatimonadetes bacterium]|jgi:hypothetical protein|nr:hypothetical protein [Gemmatimonadota bacterium]MBT6145195.1 hypothetical protein [Gemmatimonadota bacterium]MBT7859491.1 hypothetical protein [Gemmatimonadota bacterium]
MRLRLLSLSLLLSVIGAAAHDEGPQFRSDLDVSAVTPWTDLEFYNDPDHFQFAIVSDRTGGSRPGVFAAAVDRLNLLKPEFVMCVGDLIEGYTEDEAQLETQWTAFDAIVQRLEMPFFYAPGNHDIGNPVMLQKWQERRGPPYYHFEYKDVLFLVLNTEDPPPTHISDAQVAYVERALASVEEPRAILVFMHKPLWDYDDPAGFDKIEALLVGKPYTVFAGHYHEYGKYVRSGSNYYRLATTGGGSALGGPGTGQFDHIVWVTMAEEGLVMANLMLDGIYDDEPDALPPAPPDSSIAARAPRARVRIDGDPSDWVGLKSDPVTIELGPGSLASQIQYAWDDEYLFVLIRETGDDDTDGEAADAATFMKKVWRHEGISLFMDLDNSAPDGTLGVDVESWFGFSSTGRSDLFCVRTHRTAEDYCSQALLSRSVVATSGALAANDRVIEAAISWADLDASAASDRLPGGFLRVTQPGLRIGVEPLLLDDGNRKQGFIGGSRSKRPSGQDRNSRDILLTD